MYPFGSGFCRRARKRGCERGLPLPGHFQGVATTRLAWRPLGDANNDNIAFESRLMRADRIGLGDRRK